MGEVDFLTDRSPGRRGENGKHDGFIEERAQKGERKPLCFYGGAFPLSSFCESPKRETKKRCPGTFSQSCMELRRRNIAVSVCSFDSDLSGEGVVEGKEK